MKTVAHALKYLWRLEVSVTRTNSFWFESHQKYCKGRRSLRPGMLAVKAGMETKTKQGHEGNKK